MIATAEKSTALRVLTNSATSTFKRCRKLYKLSYVDCLRPVSEKKAFAFGTAGHVAINLLEENGIDTAIAFVMMAVGLDDFDRQTLAALVRGYEARYSAMRLNVVSRETAFNEPLRNPETAAPSKTWTAGGKVDGIVRLPNGNNALLERKFLGESLDAKLWNRLLVDTQISHYCLAMSIDTVIYDVIRKPAMQPYRATPIESRKYKADGTLYANQREHDETPVEWGERLFTDIMERPDFYYGRREIPRLMSDLEQYSQELWDVAKDIRDAELNNRWYRTVHRFNCDQCPYFNVCVGLTAYDGSFAPEGFQFVDDPNQELSE